MRARPPLSLSQSKVLPTFCTWHTACALDTLAVLKNNDYHALKCIVWNGQSLHFICNMESASVIKTVLESLDWGRARSAGFRLMRQSFSGLCAAFCTASWSTLTAKVGAAKQVCESFSGTFILLRVTAVHFLSLKKNDSYIASLLLWFLYRIPQRLFPF